MNFDLTTPYGNYKVRTEWGNYSNGRDALELIDVEDGERVLMATVNVPDAQIGKDELIIKNYSENEGVLEALQKAGIVGPVIGTVRTGFVISPVVKRLK